MAHLCKVGSGYQMQYYLNGRKRVKQFPKGVPKAVVEAEFKRTESELALHKVGLKRFGEDPRAAEFPAVVELTERVLASREHEVTKEAIARNRHAMRLFIAAVGKLTLICVLKPTHFDRARAKAGITKPDAVHILRHSAATTLLESGANLREIQSQHRRDHRDLHPRGAGTARKRSPARV